MLRVLMLLNVYGLEAVWQKLKNSQKMFSLVSRKFLAMRNITLYSVHNILSSLQVALIDFEKFQPPRLLISWIFSVFGLQHKNYWTCFNNKVEIFRVFLDYYNLWQILMISGTLWPFVDIKHIKLILVKYGPTYFL